MSLSKDSGISLRSQYTPVQKRNGSARKSASTSKKSLFQESSRKRKDCSSDEDSDLGPMSPLALSDKSSSSSPDSSPGRVYESPLPTPDESPKNRRNYDRLTPMSPSSPVIPKASPFTLLQRTTLAARSTPCRRIFPDSPNTPRRSPRIVSRSKDIIPETPEKEETPVKKLSTPLSSVDDNNATPKIHRRKPSAHSGMDSDHPVSPTGTKENTLKRRAESSDMSPCAKVAKTDDSMTAPKARAALFQRETTEVSKPKEFTISADKFYGAKPLPFKRPHSFGILDQMKLKKAIGKSRKSNSSSSRRKTFGEVNRGVSHGIKKKPKRAVSAKEVMKKEKKRIAEERKREKEELQKAGQGFAKKLKAATKTGEPKKTETTDKSNNKFFKSTTVNEVKATIKMEGKIKIRVGADGGLKLDKKFLKPKTHKKPTIVMDATDLTTEAPETEVNPVRINSILKTLEDDWNDDEVESTKNTGSAAPHEDVAMSPASELSNNMASAMNIDDATTVQQDLEAQGPKLYPLFNKGFQANHAFEPVDKKAKNFKKWQTSIQAGGAPDQYILDAGQKKFGATECKECGIVYQEGDAEDENQHLNYHNYVQKLKFSGWKNERVVFQDPVSRSRIINVGPKDNRVHWKKVLDILEIANAEMGLDNVMECSQKQVYLYVRENQIVGFLVVDEDIKKAHRMIPTGDDSVNCCTEDTVPAVCGVYAIWTALKNRKQGIATKLLDVLRQTLVFGYIMSEEDLAFSIPSVSGKLFAQKYTGTEEFKVYK